MTNRNSLLGRSKARERLTREEVAALEKATAPPIHKPRQAKPPENKTSDTQRTVRKNLMKFHWTMECPEYGFKVAGSGQSPARVTTSWTGRKSWTSVGVCIWLYVQLGRSAIVQYSGIETNIGIAARQVSHHDKLRERVREG